jgi:hypothetical protein
VIFRAANDHTEFEVDTEGATNRLTFGVYSDDVEQTGASHPLTRAEVHELARALTDHLDSTCELDGWQRVAPSEVRVGMLLRFRRHHNDIDVVESAEGRVVKIHAKEGGLVVAFGDSSRFVERWVGPSTQDLDAVDLCTEYGITLHVRAEIGDDVRVVVVGNRTFIQSGHDARMWFLVTGDLIDGRGWIITTEEVQALGVPSSTSTEVPW